MEYKLFSHPNVLLADHLARVRDLGIALFLRNKLFPNLEQAVCVTLLCHDLAKGSEYFQKHLFESRPSDSLSSHSEVSAIWGYHLSKKYYQDQITPLLVFAAIKHHHTDLQDFTRLFTLGLQPETCLEISKAIDYHELTDILDSCGLAHFNLSHNEFADIFHALQSPSIALQARRAFRNIQDNQWIVFNYLFSILIWADKNEAIFKEVANVPEPRKWKTEWIDQYIHQLPKGKATNVVQIIRDEAHLELASSSIGVSPLLSITMPTGTGKTLTSLDVALRISKQFPDCDRIIYCLPFTSVIDQNSNVYKSILKTNSVDHKSDLMLTHHHLIENLYNDDDTEYASSEAEFLIETWQSGLVVTTFVQFLLSFLSYKNRNLKRFHRLANSVVILDEVQTIPRKYWFLVNKVLLRLIESLHMRIILVTATQPMIFNHDSDPIVELAKSSPRWFGILDRVEIDTTGFRSSRTVENFAASVIDEIKIDPSSSRLIILNTIKSSISLYYILKKSLPKNRLIYLSSNVVPAQRLYLISKTKKNHNEGLIIVSTQVVEAGVDIDIDYVYRDIAPLDSIIQACGRCNRNSNKKKGIVKLIHLADSNKSYWRFIYDEALIDATLRTFASYGSVISEDQFLDLCQDYFKEIGTFNNNDQSIDICRMLESFNYMTALCRTKDNPSGFALIEDLPLKSVFIEVDEPAAQALIDYKKVMNSRYDDPYQYLSDRKNAVRRMSPYIITVPDKCLDSDDIITIIENDQLEQYYDLTTGFKRDPQIKDYIF